MDAIPGLWIPARSLSDKIDFVNFAQNPRPGMTKIFYFGCSFSAAELMQ